MKNTIAGYIIIAMLVITAGIFAAIFSPDSTEGKTRFESFFPATTMDNVALEVRLFGFYSTNVWADENEFLEIFQEQVRHEFKSINYKDIPKKVKFMFREILNELEDAGVKIDSISESSVNNE